MTMIIALADTQNCEAIPEHIKENASKADIILHAGDFGSDLIYENLVELSDDYGSELIMVKGNSDSILSPGYYSTLKSKNCVKSGDIKIGLAHGDLFLGDGFQKAFQNANVTAAKFQTEGDTEFGVQVLVFGHIHYPFIANGKERMLICPGSPTDPRYGSAASYAQIDINNGIVKAKIISLDIPSDYQLNGWSKPYSI